MARDNKISTTIQQEISDSVLLQGIKSGDQNCFSQFYDRYSPLIFNYLKKCFGNQEIIEDVLQELFMKIMTSPVQYDKENTKGYILRSAYHLMINHLDQEKKYIQPADHDEKMELLPDPSKTTEDILHEDANLKRLHQVLGSLPEREKSILHLKYFENLTFNEIAKIMDISSRTVMRIYGDALISAKRKLEKYQN